MTNECSATTSNIANFPELKGDFVDRLDKAAERLTLNVKDKVKTQQFGLKSAA